VKTSTEETSRNNTTINDPSSNADQLQINNRQGEHAGNDVVPRQRHVVIQEQKWDFQQYKNVPPQPVIPAGGVPRRVPAGGVPPRVPAGGVPPRVPAGCVPPRVPAGGVPPRVPADGHMWPIGAIFTGIGVIAFLWCLVDVEVNTAHHQPKTDSDQRFSVIGKCLPLFCNDNILY